MNHLWLQLNKLRLRKCKKKRRFATRFLPLCDLMLFMAIITQFPAEPIVIFISKNYNNLILNNILRTLSYHQGTQSLSIGRQYAAPFWSMKHCQFLLYLPIEIVFVEIKYIAKILKKYKGGIDVSL